jgi:hypothetical protein
MKNSQPISAIDELMMEHWIFDNKARQHALCAIRLTAQLRYDRVRTQHRKSSSTLRLV